jgi:hypothetical protein
MTVFGIEQIHHRAIHDDAAATIGHLTPTFDVVRPD